MKVLFIKNRNYLYLFSILIGISLILMSIFFIYNSPSYAVEFAKNSFFNIDVTISLNDIEKSDEKKAYLTFDDGPTTKATGKILDILKEEHVKATFFVVGKHVKEHPELVKREYEEGHYIANHGYNHNNKILYKNMDSFKNEIISTDAEISKAIGVDNYCSHIFRFPNGYMSHIYTSQKKDALGVLSSLNYVYVDWNCLNRDSEKKYSDYQLLNNLKKTSKNKGTLIILMHDTADVNKTYTVLKSSISYLKSQGYEFRNFYDLINNQF